MRNVSEAGYLRRGGPVPLATGSFRARSGARPLAQPLQVGDMSYDLARWRRERSRRVGEGLGTWGFFEAAGGGVRPRVEEPAPAGRPVRGPGISRGQGGESPPLRSSPSLHAHNTAARLHRGVLPAEPLLSGPLLTQWLTSDFESGPGSVGARSAWSSFLASTKLSRDKIHVSGGIVVFAVESNRQGRPPLEGGRDAVPR